MISNLEEAKTLAQLQGQLFCDNMSRSTTVLIPQAIILWLAWGATANWIIVALGIAILTLHSWRLLIIRDGLKHQSKSDQQWQRLCSRISFASCFHGIWIGLAAAILIPAAGPQWGVAILVIIVGIQAGSIATLSMYPRAFWSFSAPVFLGFGFGTFGLSSQTSLVLTPLYLLLLYVLYSALRNFSVVLRQTWNLRAERNMALAKAEDASYQKTQFLAAASHDLRQPAAALAFMAEELNERELPADLRPIATNIQRSSDNIRALLDKLFD